MCLQVLNWSLIEAKCYYNVLTVYISIIGETFWWNFILVYQYIWFYKFQTVVQVETDGLI